MTYHACIIGAGPAGLLAALAAARAGCRVLLLEAMDRPGRKLGLTGHGRGNLSHDVPLDDFLARFGPAAPLLKPALHSLPLPRLANLLAELGIGLTTEADGRIFPRACDARALADTLARAVCGAGAHLRCGARVQGLQPEGQGWTVTLTGGEAICAWTVILATGGRSYPATGARGDGFRLAAALGHSITLLHPGLVGLHCPGPALAQGSAAPAEVTVLAEGRALGRASGMVLATHTGLSGPAVLDVSKHATRALAEGKAARLRLAFVPGTDTAAMDARLRQVLACAPRRTVARTLEAWLPPKLAAWLADHSAVDPCLAAGRLLAPQRRALAQALTDLRLPVTGHGGWKRAMVTCGGVDRREVTARTLMSRLLPGLFFAGEILDMDGPTGGFNLHAALATGWHAGAQAAALTRA